MTKKEDKSPQKSGETPQKSPTKKTPSKQQAKDESGKSSAGKGVSRSQSMKIGDIFAKTSDYLVKRRKRVDDEQEERRSSGNIFSRVIHPLKGRSSTASSSSPGKSSGGSSGSASSGTGGSKSSGQDRIVTRVYSRISSSASSCVSYLNDKRKGMKWNNGWRSRVIIIVLFLLISFAILSLLKVTFFTDYSWTFNPLDYYEYYGY